jgi:indolepyruvate ferredoxin oxidoreductase
VITKSPATSDFAHGREAVELINGLQALVHLTLNQRKRDRDRGLDTGCFVSGYRGSPLAGLDQRFSEADASLKGSGVVFQPAINEDLAATACWGTQQLMLMPDEAEVAGISALWYGKGPGVDRSIDALKHGNHAGASRYGGVLVCAGDDHTAKSSTLGHQSEQSLIAAQIPVLYPSDVQEVLDFGVHGWEIGRQTGSWAALKCVSDVVETTRLVDVRHDRVVTVALEDNPPDDIFIKGDSVWAQLEPTVVRQRLPRVIHYARLNGLNRVVRKSPKARLGIVAPGKSYLDVMEALAQLEARSRLDSSKIAILKVGLVWPLDPEVVTEFAEGLDEILVVEEKRPIIELQIKDELYGRASHGAKVPQIVGKNDGGSSGEWSTESGSRLLRADFELTPQEIADVIELRVRKLYGTDAFDAGNVEARSSGTSSSIEPTSLVRRPYFCSGCPHNSSTKIPEGSRATAGIGCSYMASWMNRDTFTYTHMGGEGAPWSAQQHFSKRKHIFANVGDGTFFHSASLSVRQAVASKAPMTFKILFNEAVAMTGGQAHDGHLTPQKLAHMAAAEGVKRIAVVSDDIEKYRSQAEKFPAFADIHHRSELDSVQRELVGYPNVSVLIYDQTCATEKRRRRKGKLMPEAAVQVHINPDVCEGCGDCGVKSNCLSVEPIITALGPKRAINQSSCNTDLSCLAGFCPSFVTVERRPETGKSVRPMIPAVELPAPATSRLDRNLWRVLLAGVGGTGVVSLGAALASSARRASLYPSVLDMAGLAQKGGPYGVT